MLMHGHLFLRRGTSPHPTRSVKAGPTIGDGRVVDDRPVDIHVADHRGVHVHHCGVVAEDVPCPHAADEPHAPVPEPVIHPAVEADVRSPVPGVPAVHPVSPAPVARCPQQSRFRRRDPDARNPVVADIFAPRPVAGLPKVAVHWTRRLHVDRQRRRRRANRNGKSNADLRRRSRR